MEGGIKDLSEYRFSCAKEDITAAKELLSAGFFKASVNRSYYAIFHALRSVTALDQFDSNKHSGVISYFNRVYIKEGIFEKSLSKVLDQCFRLRDKADYQDFFIISIEMAKEQLKKAEYVLEVIAPYLSARWEEI